MGTVEDKIIDLHKSSMGHVLTVAEAALPPQQFRAFKKLIWDHHHNQVKHEIREIVNKRSGQGRAATDRFDKEEVAP